MLAISTSIERNGGAADSLLDALQRMSDSFYQSVYVPVVKVTEQIRGSLLYLLTYKQQIRIVIINHW